MKHFTDLNYLETGEMEMIMACKILESCPFHQFQVIQVFKEFHSFIVVFIMQCKLLEREFNILTWTILVQLHEISAKSDVNKFYNH